MNEIIRQLDIQRLNEKITQQEHCIAQLKAENAFLEQQLKMLQSELAPLKQIISVMPGNIFWKDRNGYYLGCNNNVAELVGLDSPKEIVGKRNQDIPFLSLFAEKLDSVDQAIMNSKAGKFIEEEALDENGEFAVWLSHKIPLYNNSGEVEGLLGIALNISHQKKIERELQIAKEQAEAASLAKSEFVANMSHDIKTPLAGMIGISELLSYRLKNEEAEFAKTLLTSGQQLMYFFNNCLEIFKLENGNIALAQEEFDIRQLLHEIEVLFEPITKAKELTFQTSIAADIQNYLFGSRAGIYRVILNLVANAVKFTDCGGVNISVATQLIEPSKCELIIHVQDTGLGIPLHKQKIIFERFTRLMPSYKGIYEGSGIGLYIVQKFVTDMGGHVEVTSEENKGSEFTVTIPLQIAHATTFEKSSPIPVVSKSTVNRDQVNILLVEDNLITQKIQSSLLTSMNYQVEVASSGEQALEIFAPGKFDLIFLDIGLPGIPGDAVSRRIREIEKGTSEHVPIIALTAHINDDTDHYCRAAQIEDIYSKPLSRDQAEYLVNQYCI